MKYLHIQHPFVLESGEILPRITIAYTTHGQLNERQDNVIWVAHALTGNANPVEWWDGLVGPGRTVDTDRYFVICANMLGSCYGTTGPTSHQAGSGQSYRQHFPLITVRDMVRVHILLRKQLGIRQIHLGIGGSMGGQQILEWAVMEPAIFEKVCIMASNAQHSPWGIAFNESQRMALLADESLFTDHPEAGRKGLEAARAIAMLSYRHYRTYDTTQADFETNKLEDYRASSYQRYQGRKLWERFDPFAYLSLSKSMDSHHIGRQRGSLPDVLKSIRAEALLIGIDTDVLFPIEEQALIARHIPISQLEILPSEFGHDGFLTETPAISLLLRQFLRKGIPRHVPVHRDLPPQVGAARPALPGTESF